MLQPWLLVLLLEMHTYVLEQRGKKITIFDHEIILSRGHSINFVNHRRHPTFFNSNHFGIQNIWNHAHFHHFKSLFCPKKFGKNHKRLEIISKSFCIYSKSFCISFKSFCIHFKSFCMIVEIILIILILVVKDLNSLSLVLKFLSLNFFQFFFNFFFDFFFFDIFFSIFFFNFFFNFYECFIWWIMMKYDDFEQWPMTTWLKTSV